MSTLHVQPTPTPPATPAPSLPIATRFERLAKEVCRRFSLTYAELVGPKKAKRLAEARHVLIYIARENLRMTFAEIGQRIGGRDHTTTLYGHRKMARLITTDPAMHGYVVALVRFLKVDIDGGKEP